MGAPRCQQLDRPTKAPLFMSGIFVISIGNLDGLPPDTKEPFGIFGYTFKEPL